ncbi:MAG: hypothetical protein WCH39_03290 [Schlesneria sp.]
MKFLKSWIFAVAVCSVVTSQANADVLMLASGIDARDTVAATNLNSFGAVGNTVVENQRDTSRATSVFVPGSLINKSNQATWLITQSVQHDNTARPHQAQLMTLAGRDHKITPIARFETESRPVSTFAQFVQIFKPSVDRLNNNEPVQATVNGEMTPKTSNVSLIGLLASGLVGITGLITASRRGFFSRMAR